MSAYELRIYEVVPGKMRNLQDVFCDLAIPLMAEHSIEALSFWSTPDEATFYYVVRHESLEAMKDNWGKFYADTRWTEGLAARNKGERFVTNVTGIPVVSIPNMPSLDGFKPAAA